MQNKELYDRAESFVKAQGAASCYALMKELSISYAKAVQLIDALEDNEVVQPFLRDDEGHCKPEAGPRKLMTPEFKKFYANYEKERLQRIADRNAAHDAERKAKAEAALAAKQQAPVEAKPKKRKK